MLAGCGRERGRKIVGSADVVNQQRHPQRVGRVLQLLQDLLVGSAVEIREEGNLDRGETLQMNLGADAFEAPQHLRVVLER